MPPRSLGATAGAAVLGVALGACTPVNTVPSPVSATAPVTEVVVELPPGLEVRNVDFTATTFSDVSGTGDWTSSEVGGRAFFKVYAVDTRSGDSVLLLYESITTRQKPVQIIRFRAAPK